MNLQLAFRLVRLRGSHTVSACSAVICLLVFATIVYGQKSLKASPCISPRVVYPSVERLPNTDRISMLVNDKMNLVIYNTICLIDRNLCIQVSVQHNITAPLFADRRCFALLIGYRFIGYRLTSIYK